jgi:hypothetical protein
MRPFIHRLSLILILIFAVQMTGLSCLNDWRDAAFSVHSVNHQPAFSTQSVHTAADDDGCPCHLAFVSIVGRTYSVESPAFLLGAGLRATCPCTSLAVPFHPPLGS